eukprot:CAMPEP_0170517898 /NCGR_PEP_ID=MMETSP0209-20121228/3721_1 /TAXON_ID=665100 ORGANISM="Litonotus pictus, Strain P1" /NCGR_SAMPLE_ID=MMETSP0209 /ASSEMBLY_ACC=CAM_ASM_000301 /LENGTH=102 /DNA_ID=CAMNT_0010803259 /DNA_START=931 /DNA_END=1236 /DNA_ORIENTATION=+
MPNIGLTFTEEDDDEDNDNNTQKMFAVNIETGESIKYLEDFKVNDKDRFCSIVHLEGNSVIIGTVLSQISVLNVNLFQEGKTVTQAAPMSSPSDKNITSIAV